MVQLRENDSEAEAECIDAIVKQARRPELKFDDIVSFSVRLTPLEWQQLCDIAGAESLSLHEAEAKVRELLQKA